MILRRVIAHFRKQDPPPLIPAKAGIQRAPQGAHTKAIVSNRTKMDPGLRREDWIPAFAGMSGLEA